MKKEYRKVDATLADPPRAVEHMATEPSATAAAAEIAPLVEAAVAKLVEPGLPYREDGAASDG